jgi:glycosyltransferase involved in cell wall biosynthesis
LMHIALVHNYYQERGGEDAVFEGEFELLRGKGHSVDRFTIHNDAIADRGGVALALDTLWSRSSYRRLRASFRVSRPDVVHVHNTFPLISPAVYYAAKAERAAVVQTLHNYRLICPAALLSRRGATCDLCVGKMVPWPAVQHACYRGSRAASAVTATMLLVHRLAGTYDREVDRYIALTEFGKAQFVAGGLNGAKISVTPNFVARDPGVGRGDGGYAVYVGRLSEEKGIHDLLAAWRHVGSLLPLRIIGDGPLSAHVRATSAEIPGTTVVGRLGADEVAAELQGAKALMFPTQVYEGLPMAIIEAFAVGTPVVASRIGASEEVVEHGRTGLLVAPHDPAQLAAAARWVADHDDELTPMRRAARGEYEQKYSPDAHYRQLMTIYAQAMAVT